MKASELRIGNIVCLKGYPDNQIIIDGIQSGKYDSDQNGINLYLGGDSYGVTPYMSALYSFDQIESIPITEDWLIKFGFELYQRIEEYDEVQYRRLLFSEFIYVRIYTDGRAKTYACLPGLYTDAPCQFVHQLQNLYFALTGEELTIKP